MQHMVWVCTLFSADLLFFCLYIVLAAANKCLSSFTLRPKKRTAKQELSSLFRKKQKFASGEPVSSSKCLWKHRFVCLAFCDQDKIPTCDADKDELLRAGLGEKEIKFYDLNIEAEEFRDLLYKEFPSLKKGGGFQFLKCLPNSRNLQLLSSSTLSSPLALKTRIGAGRTYIRPLQQDLPLSVLFDLPSGVRAPNFLSYFFHFTTIAKGEMFNLWK